MKGNKKTLDKRPTMTYEEALKLYFEENYEYVMSANQFINQMLKNYKVVDSTGEEVSISPFEALFG